MATMLSIDLGSYTVKIAVYEGSFGRFQLSDCRSAAVRQGDGPDLARRMAALASLLPTRERSTTLTAFPTEHASVRLVKLPFGDRGQVERTLPVEVEGQIPFDLDDVVLSSRILSLAPTGSQVLVALADKSAVSELLDAYEQIDVDPRHLFLDGDLLSQFSTEGTAAVVDFGHSRTLVSLVRDGKTLATRALTQGGRELTAALAARRGLEWGAAEAAKHIAQLPDPGKARPEDQLHAEVEWDEEDTNPVLHQRRDAARQLAGAEIGDDGEILLAALAPLLSDLRASLVSFEDACEAEVDELLLIGGASALSGLPELLYAELGVPVRRVDPNLLTGDGDAPATFALALALGERAMGKSSNRDLDLRTGEFVYRGDMSTLVGYLGYAAVALVCFLLVGAGLYTWRSVQTSRARAGIEAQISEAVQTALPETDAARLADPTMAVAVMQEQSAALRARVEALQGVLSEEPPTLSLLQGLSRAVPGPDQARIDVAELTMTETAATMKGETDGFESATKIETSLQSNPRFAEAQKGDSKKVGEAVRFTISIPLASDGVASEEE